MKKIIIGTLASAGLVVGAFAQGSLTQVQGMFSTDGITTEGAFASDPANATTYFTGSITLQLFYASTGAVTANQIAAINALDGTSGGGAAALALMTSDGFSLVTATLNYIVSDGGFTAADANTINLLSPAPTGVVGWIGMYAVNGNTSGVLAFSQNTGGNPTTTPAGVAANMTTDPAGLNLVLTSTPEPTTIALAGLGIAGLVALRRKK